MAYNERSAERVRDALAGYDGISERKMFGGIAFLVDGKMCVGVLGDDLLVRSGKERYAEAMNRAHTRPMDFTGRVSTGMLYVAPPGFARGASLQRWIDLGLAAAREAPARTRSARKATGRGS